MFLVLSLVHKKSALLVYKQTILLFLDCVGFVLLCNIGMRRELQILQNNALRLCLRYHLADIASIQQLNGEARLQSVEQRGIFQLLKLIYGYSRNASHLKVLPRLTRAGAKRMFDMPTRWPDKDLNSPLNKGSQIWDLLPEYVQHLSIYPFISLIYLSIYLINLNITFNTNLNYYCIRNSLYCLVTVG